MSIADDFGFSDENKGLCSFITLLKILQDLREPDADSDWSTYLTCVSVMPGAGHKPTNPLCLPLGFPLEGPPKPLTKETAESMERRFATLRGLRKQLEDSIGDSGTPDPAVVREVGPQAMAAIRGLGNDLEVHRFGSGETYVLGLKMRQAIPPDRVSNAELIQIEDEWEDLWESYTPGAGSVLVMVVRLVYRLPDDPANRVMTPARRDELNIIREQIERTFIELFPGNHARIEFRDCEAVTLLRGPIVGPTYNEAKQKDDQMMVKVKRS